MNQQEIEHFFPLAMDSGAATDERTGTACGPQARDAAVVQPTRCHLTLPHAAGRGGAAEAPIEARTAGAAAGA